MSALFYLLTLTLCCLLQNGFGGQYEDFKANDVVKHLLERYFNRKIKRDELLTEVNKIKGLEMRLSTLKNYLMQIKEDDGSCRMNIEKFKSNPRAMFLVEKYNNSQITMEQLLIEVNKIKGLEMSLSTLYRYLNKIEEEADWDTQNESSSSAMLNFSNPSPLIQAPQIAQQFPNFTSGNPGSSTSTSNKVKSSNFSKAPVASSHYGGALPFQQVPSTDDTFVPSQAGTDSTSWFEENMQNDDGSLQSMVNPKHSSSWKRALGAVSKWFGASTQEPQFSPSMHDTTAASSYYPSNQLDDQTLVPMFTPRNPSSSKKGSAPTSVPFRAGTHSLDWIGGNSQDNEGDLYSVIRPKNPSSSKGFDGTPFLPNQLQSTRRTGASNVFSPTRQSSNFNSGNPGSSSHYGSAMPFQQAPMPGTSSFSSFPNYPCNQSAPLNTSTNFVLSQPGTPSLDWSGGNSQDNEGDLYSVVRQKKRSSSKGKNATKTGKKPRK